MKPQLQQRQASVFNGSLRLGIQEALKPLLRPSIDREGEMVLDLLWVRL
jgi:hypothetical protein